MRVPFELLSGFKQIDIDFIILNITYLHILTNKLKWFYKLIHQYRLSGRNLTFYDRPIYVDAQKLGTLVNVICGEYWLGRIERIC